MIHDRTVNLIADDEGFRSKVYTDSKGFPTIGFGFNLTNVEIPISVALDWLGIIISNIEHDLEKYLPFWNNLSDARKYVLINMAYQMGVNGLLNFHNMIKSLSNKNYSQAAIDMKDSLWYREFTNRASRLQKIMISGEF